MLVDVILAARAWLLESVSTPSGVIVVSAVVGFLLCVGAVTTLRWLVQVELLVRHRARRRATRRREVRLARRAMRQALLDALSESEAPERVPEPSRSRHGSDARVTPITAARTRPPYSAD